MTTSTAERTATAAFRPSPMRQIWVFAVREALRVRTEIGQSIILAAFTPTIFLACFLATQRKIMEAQGIEYAQFLPPWVLVQVLFFLGGNAAVRVAQDAQDGVLRRTRTLPISAVAPALGRAVIHFGHALVAIVVLLAVAFAFGFRFHGDPLTILLFFVVALVLAMIVNIGFEAVALMVGAPDAVSPVLLLPTLIFSLMSVGLVPAERFPSWISGFVTQQPVSRVIAALRDLAAGTVGASLGIAAAWLAALAALALASAAVTMRRSR